MNKDVAQLVTDMEKSMFFDGRDFIPKKAGDYILGLMNVRTLEGTDEMYYYDQRGYYVPRAEERIKEVCASLLADDFTSHRCSEVTEYIKTQTYISPDHKEDGQINLANGILNLNSMQFIGHSPDYFHTKQIPITYDPAAKCPLWLEQLAVKILGLIVLLQQIFGYCLTTGQRFEKAFLFYGPRRTMKSTVLSVLTWLLGEDNVTSFSLQELNEDNFTRAYVYGKSANIYADLSPKELRDTATFMLWTGQDGITAAKKHQHPFTFKPDAKLLFSCNDVPPTCNKNLAYYRRWVLMPFVVQHEKVDPDMRDKLRAELPGILNWAIAGLKSLEQKKCFDYSLSDEDIQDLYERQSDTVQSFIRNRIDTEDDDGVEVKRTVRMSYEQYCKANGLRCLNHIAFGRLFKDLTGCGVCKKNGLPAYSGVKLGGSTEEQAKLDNYGGEEDR